MLGVFKVSRPLRSLCLVPSGQANVDMLVHHRYRTMEALLDAQVPNMSVVYRSVAAASIILTLEGIVGSGRKVPWGGVFVSPAKIVGLRGARALLRLACASSSYA